MEVSVRLRFTTPSLGDIRSSSRDLMRRDSNGKVIYLQAWWRATLKFAAHAISRHYKEVEEIQADPLIDGEPKVYKRYYSLDGYKEHEAFLDGDEITARFLLPNKLSIEEFRQLLEVAGQYAGISPYGFKQNFGRFVVISIDPIRRAHVSIDPSFREPHTGGASNGVTVNASIAVHETHPEGR